MIRSLTLLGAWLCAAPFALAHDPGLSSATLQVGASQTDVSIVIATQDASRLVPLDANGDGEVSAAEFAAALPALRELTARWITMVSPVDTALDPSVGEPEWREADADVALHATLNTGLPGRWVIEFPELFNLGSQHRHFVTVVRNEQVLLEDFATAAMGRLAFTNRVVESTAGAGAVEPEASHANFFVLGIEHILTGYDHLLFLAGLIVVCHRLKSIITIITSFTIAHSITLGVATLGHLDLPSRWVEPLIAASIVFVGVENLIRKGEEPPGRWVLTFIFGLIHGFGFAGLLRELGVGQNGGSIVRPLLEFNLGVEAGQIAIAALAVPLLRWAQKAPAFARYGQPAISSLVVALGAWWLFERVLG